MHTITPPRIATERMRDCVVEDDLTGLAELALAYNKEPMGPIDIAAFEPDSFADAHTGCCEQAQESLVRRAAKLATGYTGRLQLTCRAKQACDFFGRVDQGWRAATVARQEIARWDLMA